MIKKVLSLMILFLMISFFVSPVYATDPGTFTKVTGKYPNDIDYRNSLVDWNGYNLDFDIIKDTAGGLDPLNTNIYLIINGVNQFNLQTWDKLYPNDPQDYQYKLRITNTQKQLILRVLFDRKADTYTLTTGDYLGVYPRNHAGDLNAFAFYFRIYFSGFLDINFGSVYISDNLIQSNTGVINNFSKGVWIRDKNMETIDNFEIDNETTQPIKTGYGGDITTTSQRAIYNFTNRITNVKSVDLIFQISANPYDPRPEITYFINEIGFFASEQVVLPDYNVDTDFQIYEPTICALLDIACISRNMIGEFSNNIYNKLGAESIASGVMSVYDTVFYPVYIINNTSWQNGILSIYAILSIGVLYLIVKRVLS